MNVKKTSLVEVFLGIILSFYIYSADFIFLPVDTSKLLWLIFLALLVIFNPLTAQARKVLYNFIPALLTNIPVVIFGIFLLSYSIIIGAKGYTFPTYIILYYIDVLLVAIFIVSMFALFKFSKWNVLNVLIYVGLFQSAMMFSMMLIPTWKELYMSLTSTNPLIRSYYDYRYVGITGFANYTVGTTQAVILFIAFLKFYELKCFKFSNILTLSILLLSSIFASRSSLIVCVLLFFSFIIFNVRNDYFLKRLTPTFFVTFLLLSIFVFYLVTNEVIMDTNLVLRWALEPIYNLVHFGELRTNSSDTIDTFYFMPNQDTFYWGDWKYTNDDGSYYQGVDAGYMRVLLFMGVYLSAFFYILVSVSWLLTCYFLRRKSKGVIYNLDVLFVSMIAIFFVLQYKGNIFVDGYSMMKIMFILLLSNHCKYIRG
ncbi:hypothetical protein H8R01_11505 [Vibrio metschnikovii]|uniref:hypothetical protein n=1 Tax=Vibrio metschnikovii TaxID=28172 RepID=UPI001646EFAD|nr:hypothetical protein [Vibrio metschnikovii]MBC3618016.1 hypothetical protein [Vibrio metschnikovii]MBC5813952.1 hypothetical protein [Vibrio metschnikovii]